MFRAFLALVAFLGLASAGRTASVINVPLADTYFEAYGSEQTNFGHSPVLRVDQWGGRQAFLRFDIRNVPLTNLLTRVTLRLFVTEVGFNEAGEFPELRTCFSLHDVTTHWIESGLTYESPDGTNGWVQGPGLRPPAYADVRAAITNDIGLRLARKAIAFPATAVTNGAWLEFDLTDYVRRCRTDAVNDLNVVLGASTLGRNCTFASRENPTPGIRPQLVVEWDHLNPAVRLQGEHLRNWKTGQTARVFIRRNPADGRFSGSPTWSIIAKPHGSRITAQDLSSQDTELSFVPDQPGRYVFGFEMGKNFRPISAEVSVLSIPAHPRLYVTAESLARLRAQTAAGNRLNEAFLNWVTAGSREAERGRFHDLGPHEGCENNSLAWLLTGREEYLTNAAAYASRVLSRPMPEHFQDVHEATFTGAAWVHAMAVHYDWCHDSLAAERRQEIADWLKQAAFWSQARSGAPIAHNDGGARQCLLGAAALALMNDDPGARALWRMARENFDQRLLPWLNDGGRGGRAGDGGEYEGLHAFYILRYAWMSQTATAEDLFSESPFFVNRLRHLLFGWYPQRLWEKHGRFSMRQYYSPSGDHIRMGYVGDTQPYQSAAALAWRYPQLRETQAVRQLAGEWPVEWMQYTLRWALLGEFETVPPREPNELAYLDPGANTLYARSDWSDEATWVLFENAPFVSAHTSLDSGTFEIFKGDLLAARTGNLDHGNVGAPHTVHYLRRTIAGNCLLIHDPEEKWRGFLGGAEGAPDGGGQRTNFPLTSSPDAETYLNYRSIFQRGQITRALLTDTLAYAMADLAPAYNSFYFHGGNLNRPKVSTVTRQFLYLRPLDSVLVYDRTSTTQPEFKTTFLLHSLGELDVLNGKETPVDEGEFRYAGATRAVIRYGWPKPTPTFGRCQAVFLLPPDAEVRKIGGRIDLPLGQTEGFAGDPWHEQHPHRHVKDFWVNGTNYPPGNPPETRWFGVPGTPEHVPGTPDESGGRGKWRLEVSPAEPAFDDVFFTVLSPRLGSEGPFPSVERSDTENFHGAVLVEGESTAALFFARKESRQTRFSGHLPNNYVTWVIADLEPGEYLATGDGEQVFELTVRHNGVAVAQTFGGRLELRRK